MKNYLLIAILSLIMLSGCASQSHEDQANAAVETNAGDPRDPLESINRDLWYFNWEILDQYLLRPVTIAYTEVLPTPARTGLRNAARNLEEPGNMLNNLLQGKGKKGFDSLSRFAINSTVGVFGLIDVADMWGIQRQDEDLDETMAIWGVGSGPYVMVPALGPNDTRGFVGDVGDNILFPMTVLSSPLNIGRILINIIESRASLIAQEEQLRQSPDDYAFVKNAFFQNKAFTINDGQILIPDIDDDQLDDFEDFEAFLDGTECEGDDCGK